MEITEEKFKEWISLAVQSGKQETSNLVSHLQDKIDQSVERAVNKYVNGKIDKMQKHLENQDIVLQNIQEEQQKIKIETGPVVEIQKTTKNVGKFIMWSGGIGIAITGLVKLISKL